MSRDFASTASIAARSAGDPDYLTRMDFVVLDELGRKPAASCSFI